MGITGKWYMQPGDIPADFVFPLILHEDGRAEWPGAAPLEQRYVTRNGELLIGEGNGALRFRVPADDAEPTLLSGDILYPLSEEEIEEQEDDLPPYYSDCAALLRDPGKLEIVDYQQAPAPKDQAPLLL